MSDPLPAGVVDRIRDSSATIGVVAAIATIWIGASFWGAMDTAFCRIYHVECRGWVEQKRWALLMLLVIILFLPASVLVPVAEGLLASGAADLPFGLDNVGALRTLGVLFAALMLAGLATGPVQGALVMALFAAGSGVSLALAPWLWQRLGRGAGIVRQEWGTRLAGGLLAVVALQAVWMDLSRQIRIWCG